MIKSVNADSPSSVTVELMDGRVQVITIEGLDKTPEDVVIEVKEYIDGELVREETAKN